MTENAELVLAGTALPQEGWEYDDFVAAGRRVQQVHGQVTTLAAWRIGDLAAAVGTKYGDRRLEQFADDIGAQPSTVRAHRAVARAFPESDIRISNLPWALYQVLASQDDRHELIRQVQASGGMTVTKARELVASRKPQPEAKLEPEREPAAASPGLKAS